jgi:hypothetical protein
MTKWVLGMWSLHLYLYLRALEAQKEMRGQSQKYANKSDNMKGAKENKGK